MLYCSPIGGVKGNIEAGWGRPSTAWKFLFEKMRIFKKKVFSTCDSPGQVPAASHPDSAPPSTNLQDMVVIKDVGFPNPPPKASDAGNLSIVDPATPLPAFAQRVTIVLYQFIDNRSEYENVTTNQYPKLNKIVDFATTAH